MIDIALVQSRSPATQAAALAHISPLVREAAATGARLVVTPEGTNLLQRHREELFKVLVPLEDDEAVLGLRALAAELSIWLLIGSAMVRREDGKAANRSVLIDPSGAIAATYDKLHMFPPANISASRRLSSREPGR